MVANTLVMFGQTIIEITIRQLSASDKGFNYNAFAG